MLPIINLGPLAIQVPGLILLVGLWIGLSFTERWAVQINIAPNKIYNCVFIALIAGVIGARLSYVFRFPEAFISSPISVVSLNPALLDIWGGIAAGFIAALIYGIRSGLKFWPTLDAITPLIGMFAIAIAISNLASGSAFGSPSELPWSIELWGIYRHPTQIYETISSSLIFVLLWTQREKFLSYSQGTYFLTFLALSAGSRLIIEAFRGDSILIMGNFRAGQFVSWIILAISLFSLLIIRPPKETISSK